MVKNVGDFFLKGDVMTKFYYTLNNSEPIGNSYNPK